MMVCKVCNIQKVREYSGLTSAGSARFKNDLGKYWSGYTCPECHSSISKQKMLAAREKKKSKKILELKKLNSSCRNCGALIEHSSKKFCSIKCNHKDWSKRNKDKRKIYQQERNKGSYKKVITCISCSKEIVVTHPKIKKCKECKVPKKRVCKLCNKELNKQKSFCSIICKKVYKSYGKTTPIEFFNCEVCNKVFLKKSIKHKCCSRLCFEKCESRKKYHKSEYYKEQRRRNPKRKEKRKLYKTLLKRAKINRKPQWCSWEEISYIYMMCPEGYHVDHIIPLNHPLVSGLHCKDNLQYLSPEDNTKKSNQFDGTSENNSWRKPSNK